MTKDVELTQSFVWYCRLFVLCRSYMFRLKGKSIFRLICTHMRGEVTKVLEIFVEVFEVSVLLCSFTSLNIQNVTHKFTAVHNI